MKRMIINTNSQQTNLGKAYILDRLGRETIVENHPSKNIEFEVPAFISEYGNQAEMEEAIDYLVHQTEDIKQHLNKIYDEKWCKVRVWGRMQEEVTFRITSTGFNWYTIIVDFLLNHTEYQNSKITVESNKDNAGYKQYWNQESVEDILDPKNETILSNKLIKRS